MAIVAQNGTAKQNGNGQRRRTMASQNGAAFKHLTRVERAYRDLRTSMERLAQAGEMAPDAELLQDTAAVASCCQDFAEALVAARPKPKRQGLRGARAFRGPARRRLRTQSERDKQAMARALTNATQGSRLSRHGGLSAEQDRCRLMSAQKATYFAAVYDRHVGPDQQQGCFYLDDRKVETLPEQIMGQLQRLTGLIERVNAGIYARLIVTGRWTDDGALPVATVHRVIGIAKGGAV